MKKEHVQIALAFGGAVVAFLALRKRGGVLGAIGDTLVGEDGLGEGIRDIVAGERIGIEELPSVSGPPEFTAGPGTSANPKSGKPFVIPVTGDILIPLEDSKVSRKLFSDEYPVQFEIQNAQLVDISGTADFEATESSLFGDDEYIEFSSPELLIPAKSSRRFTIGMPMATGSNLFGINVFLSMKFAGRPLDRVSFRLS